MGIGNQMRFCKRDAVYGTFSGLSGDAGGFGH